ncbi:hypothetical protein CPC08DRAFT_726661 [Agrocybe pediades]|nr:hypothetical protein CPC08DRAFT_726661 [Agrocybe pediades]
MSSFLPSGIPVTERADPYGVARFITRLSAGLRTRSLALLLFHPFQLSSIKPSRNKMEEECLGVSMSFISQSGVLRLSSSTRIKYVRQTQDEVQSIGHSWDEDVEGNTAPAKSHGLIRLSVNFRSAKTRRSNKDMLRRINNTDNGQNISTSGGCSYGDMSLNKAIPEESNSLKNTVVGLAFELGKPVESYASGEVDHHKHTEFWQCYAVATHASYIRSSDVQDIKDVRKVVPSDPTLQDRVMVQIRSLGLGLLFGSAILAVPLINRDYTDGSRQLETRDLKKLHLTRGGITNPTHNVTEETKETLHKPDHHSKNSDDKGKLNKHQETHKSHKLKATPAKKSKKPDSHHATHKESEHGGISHGKSKSHSHPAGSKSKHHKAADHKESHRPSAAKKSKSHQTHDKSTKGVHKNSKKAHPHDLKKHAKANHHISSKSGHSKSSPKKHSAQHASSKKKTHVSKTSSHSKSRPKDKKPSPAKKDGKGPSGHKKTPSGKGKGSRKPNTHKKGPAHGKPSSKKGKSKKAPARPKSPTKPKPPSKTSSSEVEMYTGGGIFEDAERENNARQSCSQPSDCKCPFNPNAKTMHSTSCINNICSCDNPVIGEIGKDFMKGVAAIGNAPITKAIGQVMQGIADVKEILPTIAGAVLGPEAKAALKVAINVLPETGPSHIDQAGKKLLTSAL